MAVDKDYNLEHPQPCWICWHTIGILRMLLSISCVKVFRVFTEYRILRLTFHRKATDHLNLKYCEYLVAILQVLRLEFQKFRILEILNFHPWHMHYVPKFHELVYMFEYLH